MDNFYILISALGAISVLMLWTINFKGTQAEEMDSNGNDALLDEMYRLLNTVDLYSETEEEHHARYRDIRSKYKDTLAVLGHEFPEYKPKVF